MNPFPKSGGPWFASCLRSFRILPCYNIIKMKYFIAIIACFVAFSMNSQVDRVLVNGNEIHTSLNLLELESIIETLQAQVAALQTAQSSSFDGTYGSLTGAPTIPTNTTELTNGAGYITDGDLPLSLGLNAYICVGGLYPTQQNLGGDDFAAIGEIKWAAFNLSGGGMWLKCEGQVLDIANNTALFSLIGVTYGGDGFSTFALPDLRDRGVIGVGPNTSLGEVVQ